MISKPNIPFPRVAVYCAWLVICTTAANARLSTVAERCGANTRQSPKWVFADAAGKREWRPYSAPVDVPEIKTDAGESALVWTAGSRRLFVEINQPGEDFVVVSNYCYDKSGALIAFSLDVRTAWGWGYFEQGVVVNGSAEPTVSRFFNTKSEASIAKPLQAADIPEALKPQVYLRKSSLPFAEFLVFP